MSNFSYILSLLNKRTAKRKNTDPLKIVYNNLAALNAQIQHLNTPEQDYDEEEVRLRPHKMTPGEYDSLMQAYNTLITSIQKATVSDKKNLSQQYLDELMRMTNRDLEGLHRANKANLSDYHSMVDDSAHYTADIRGKDLASVGGAASTRISMSVADGKGGYVDGYFTADSRLNPDACVKEAFEDAVISCQDSKALCDALKQRFDEFGSLERAGYWLFGEEHADFQDPGYTEHVSPHGKSAEYLKRLSDLWNQKLDIRPAITLTLRQLQSLHTLTRQIYGIGFNRHFLANTAHIEQGGVIGQRNAAMSAVADYLGVPDLIARSSQMSVLVGNKDGKPVYRNGTFMEKAPGVHPDEILETMDVSVVSPNANNLAMLKSIVNLQVLDYICGNVDRHRGNFLVKTEIENGILSVKGIVGIDNDAAFGEIDVKEDTHALRAPAHMGCITKDMADKISQITPKELQQVLSGFGLRNREIAAAWNRVKTLQQYVKDHKKDFVKDDQALKNMTVADISKANSSKTNQANILGIGTICDRNFRHLKVFCDLKQMLQGKIGAKLRKDAGQHSMALDKKASDIAFRAVQKWYKLSNDAREKYIDIAKSKANWDLLSSNDKNKNYVRVMKNAVAFFYDEAEKTLLEEYEQKMNPSQNAPAEHAITDQKINRTNDKAARLAEVQNKLEDILATFEPTLREHGMTRTCKNMHESLKNLLVMTRTLKENTIQNPGLYNEESWNAFKDQLQQTLDNTCYYISKKPLNPRHPYGQERLDAARQLRSATFGALQMAIDEMPPKQELEKFRADNALNAQKQNAQNKEKIQINVRS